MKKRLIVIFIILICLSPLFVMGRVSLSKENLRLLYLRQQALEFAEKYKDRPAIFISKKDHLLYFCKNGEIVENDRWNGQAYSFPVKVSLASKYYKTPEGEMFISHKNPKSQFILFLGFSYPGTYGLHSGVTRLASYLEKQEKKDPDFTFVTKKDDTRGCVAVENRVIKYLYANVPVKTPVLIVP
ncbi:MAG: L,D-transpeptidase [bacterium]